MKHKITHMAVGEDKSAPSTASAVEHIVMPSEDILDRLNSRLIEPDQKLIEAAIDEIWKLRQKAARRGKLLQDIYNNEELRSGELCARISDELMGHNT